MKREKTPIAVIDIVKEKTKKKAYMTTSNV